MIATASLVKELRNLTSCGVMECKKALEETQGNIDKAKKILRQRGLELAAKKGGRVASEGRIEAYIHGGAKIGVLVEVHCETDFVASNEDFVQFSKDCAMQIAAANPQYVKREDIPEDESVDQSDLDSYAKQVCLLEQPFVKDSKKTLQDNLNELIAKIGENIFVGRFTRYKVNEVE